MSRVVPTCTIVVTDRVFYDNVLCAGCRMSFRLRKVVKVPMTLRPTDLRRVRGLKANLCEGCRMKMKVRRTEPAQWWSQRVE